MTIKYNESEKNQKLKELSAKRNILLEVLANVGDRNKTNDYLLEYIKEVELEFQRIVKNV